MSNDIDPQKLAEKLKALDEPFAAASTEERSGFGDDIPDGNYQAVTQRWGYFETKRGATCTKLVFEIALDEDYQGSTVEKTYNLEPQVQDPSLTDEEIANRLGFLKRDLIKLGADEDVRLSELVPGSEILQNALDLPVEIAIKTNANGYQNIYINAVLGGHVQGGAAGFSARSDIPTDLEPQTLPGVPAGKGAQSAIDDDIPF